MMDKDTEKYAEWLALDYIKLPEYSNLISYMLKFPFIYTVKNDANRAYDGLDIRKHYIRETNSYPFKDRNLCCTFAEFLCALADRIDFVFYMPEYGHRQYAYFKMMLRNLHVDWATDDTLSKSDVDRDVLDLFSDAISGAIDRINDRSYDPDGQGGIFPLRYAEEDQRKVEIWMQLAAYISENKEYMKALQN